MEPEQEIDNLFITQQMDAEINKILSKYVPQKNKDTPVKPSKKKVRGRLEPVSSQGKNGFCWLEIDVELNCFSLSFYPRAL